MKMKNVKNLPAPAMAVLLCAAMLIQGLFWGADTVYAEDTAEDTTKYDDDYNISTLLGNYQFFVQGDVTGGGHTVGAIVVGGTLNKENTFGDAALVPSYVSHIKNGSFGTGWSGKDKCSIVYYDQSDITNLNKDVWIQNPSYIDVEGAFKKICAQSKGLADSASFLEDNGGLLPSTVPEAKTFPLS